MKIAFTLLDNKYRRWHDAILEQARDRAKIQHVTEEHHRIPRSIGGSNEKKNLFNLFPREHFLIHWLLIKCTRGVLYYKMRYALILLTTSSKNIPYRIVAGWQFALARKMLSQPKSLETRQNMSRAAKGRPKSEEHKKKIGDSHRGKTISTEQKVKMSLKLTGKKKSPESIEKTRQGHLGKKRSAGARKNIKEGIKRACAARNGERTYAQIIAQLKAGIARKGKKLTEQHKHALQEGRERFVENRRRK